MLYLFWKNYAPVYGKDDQKHLSFSLLGLHIGAAVAARQPYDVRKIIQAFKQSHDDLKIFCAHRGLR